AQSLGPGVVAHGDTQSAARNWAGDHLSAAPELQVHLVLPGRRRVFGWILLHGGTEVELRRQFVLTVAQQNAAGAKVAILRRAAGHDLDPEEPRLGKARGLGWRSGTPVIRISEEQKLRWAGLCTSGLLGLLPQPGEER